MFKTVIIINDLYARKEKRINMIILKPYIFRLSLYKNKVHLIYDIEKEKNILKFSSPLTNNRFKIYILKSDDKIHYIGTTKSSIKSRLRIGLNPNGQFGYHGYKWKILESVMLYVFCFDHLDKIQIESIEAELVFIVRKTTGRWPESQNEIHFNNDFIPEGKLIAERIYNQLN